jgi:hypothetical protein
MELRIEIGGNLRKIIERAGSLNEKWDDVVYAFKEFLRQDDVKDLVLLCEEYDGEIGIIKQKVSLSKVFREESQPELGPGSIKISTTPVGVPMTASIVSSPMEELKKVNV